MNKREYFLKIFKKAEKRYGRYNKRLAGDGWDEDWKTLITTIMSAQSRDETTILIAENLFKKYKSLKLLSKARYKCVLEILKSLNYNKTKAKNIIKTSKILVKEYNEKIPDTIEELIKLHGVGRKTANLVLSEVHKKDEICVDTHVHRICNVLGLVNTKTPEKTEIGLKKITPKKYWSKINRIFVLWGKDVPGRDKKKMLNNLNQ